MKVYHGSLHQIHNPDIEKGRLSTDFGKGFYTTTNFEQAKRWAIKKQKSAKAGSAIVNTYEVDDNLFNNLKYNIKKFCSPDEEWLRFVVNCRKSASHKYDVIFGAVANDKIYTTITLYEAQVLTAEETVARLKVDEYFNQISFHSQDAANELKYLESEEVTE
ncbi:MAG: DUF3990 domain-containing protein [Dysgonamonadaceae bacterium]|jgi:hypothetical protein|nr:DUF3990 domain-containing protein [Dysgonamonadaceae bacterium]